MERSGYPADWNEQRAGRVSKCGPRATSKATSTAPSRATPGQERLMPVYTLPELPYDMSALEPHYSAEVLELHHDKHHAAYVAGANTTLERLGEARDSDDYGSINMLQKNLAFHLSGHVLHSMFWENLSPDGGGKPEGELDAAIADGFGGFDHFRSQLTEAALAVQGSGWGALTWEPLGKRLIVEQVY